MTLIVNGARDRLMRRHELAFLNACQQGRLVVVPGVGAIVLPSQFGRKYSGGLAQGPAFPVFVTRGVGTSGPPVRFYCRPEIVLLTLV